MVLLEIILLGLLTISTRVAFLIAPSSDKATQLWIINLFARNRRIHPLTVHDGLKQGRLAYPPLPHALLAFLPPKLRLPAAMGLNLGCDVLHVSLIYGVLHSVLPTRGQEIFSYSFLFAALFATLPILHPVNARLVAIGARTLAPLLVTSYFLSLVAADSISSSFYLLAIILGAGVVLTSQFGLQVVFAFSVILSISCFSVIPILVLSASIISLIFVPGVDIKGQLNTKLKHYIWYFTSENNHIQIRNNISYLINIISQKKRFSYMKIIIYSVISLSPVIIFIGIGSVILLILISVSEVGWPAGILADTSTCILMAAIIACVATVAGPLRVLGEAERYIEYAAPFLIILSAFSSIAANLPNDYIWLTLLLNLIGVSLQWSVMFATDLRRSFLFELDEQLAEVVEFLDQKSERRVIASPIFLASALAIGSRHSHKFLHVLIVDPDGTFSHWRDDMIGYPDMRGNTERYIMKYSADTFVATHESFAKIRSHDPSADFGNRAIAFQNKKYVVFDLSRSERN